MEKCKKVYINNGKSPRCSRLEEMKGIVAHSETISISRTDSELHIRLRGDRNILKWTYQASMPAHIVVGDNLRVFYDKTTLGFKKHGIILGAYELLDNAGEKVLTRSAGAYYGFLKQ